MLAVLSTLGKPVATRAFALMVAVGIPAFVVFAGNGLSAAEVVRLMHASSWIRACVWTGWILLTTPAVRALFESRGTGTLRSLRLPVPLLLVVLTLPASLIQLPLIVLFARGAGLGAAASVLACAVSLESSIQVAARRTRYVPIALVLAGVLVVDPPGAWTLVLGSAAAPWCLLRAWRLAPERAAEAVGWLRPTTPLLALYGTHLLRLIRSSRPRLLAAAMLTAASALAIYAGFRNDPDERSLTRALGILTIPLATSVAVCVTPLLECEAILRPVLRSLRVRRRTIVSAFLLALTTPASALAASAGAVSTATCPGLSSAAPLVFSIWAAALALPIGVWGRRHERLERPSAGKFVAGVLLVMFAALALVSAW